MVCWSSNISVWTILLLLLPPKAYVKREEKGAQTPLPPKKNPTDRVARSKMVQRHQHQLLHRRQRRFLRRPRLGGRRRLRAAAAAMRARRSPISSGDNDDNNNNPPLSPPPRIPAAAAASSVLQGLRLRRRRAELHRGLRARDRPGLGHRREWLVRVLQYECLRGHAVLAPGGRGL